jgi:hypothetical protein
MPSATLKTPQSQSSVIHPALIDFDGLLRSHKPAHSPQPHKQSSYRKWYWVALSIVLCAAAAYLTRRYDRAHRNLVSTRFIASPERADYRWEGHHRVGTTPDLLPGRI